MVRLLFLLFPLFLFADTVFDARALPVPIKRDLVPLDKTHFEIIDYRSGREHAVDLTNRDFVLVSVREPGSDGRFYAVDKDGTVWLSGPVTSGAAQFRTPSGVFHVRQKARHHMSNRYPDESGVNNMDYMMKFTKWGHALHKGDVNWMSHGCIHIDPNDVVTLYNWVRIGMPIVITRHSYMPFAREDLRRIY